MVARKIRSHDVLEVLADLFVRHGPPEYLRSDNGPEFTAKLQLRLPIIDIRLPIIDIRLRNVRGQVPFLVETEHRLG